MYSTSVGAPVNSRGREWLKADKNKPGYVLYGPYTRYEPGAYVANFHVEVDGAEPGETIVCGRADVTIDAGRRMIAQTSLYGSRLGECGRIALPFQLADPAEVEFRVYTTGRFPMLVSPAPLICTCAGDEAKHCPVFPAGYRPQTEFVDQYFGDIRFLYENGVDLIERDESLIGSFQGTHFLLDTIEDFQVVNEVFFTNEYNVIGSRAAIFADVGMNSGMTSLFAAAQPNIEHVYGFEPFSGPFRRALKNFSINAGLKAKITASHFGLGAEDAALEVVADPFSTIGTSIRGRDGEGQLETIAIRNAAEALSGIVLQAVERRQAVFLKLDCEGSEFAIMQSLVRANLLRSIDVVMIEWHKWWSADLSQKDIVQALLDAGFIVFDRTTPANVFAGMLYAVRQ